MAQPTGRSVAWFQADIHAVGGLLRAFDAQPGAMTAGRCRPATGVPTEPLPQDEWSRRGDHLGSSATPSEALSSLQEAMTEETTPHLRWTLIPETAGDERSTKHAPVDTALSTSDYFSLQLTRGVSHEHR